MTATLGWIGNVFLIWGIWEIGNKRRFAHLLTVVGEVSWIAKCLMTTPPTWDLAVICAIFTVLAARCWVLWAPEKSAHCTKHTLECVGQRGPEVLMWRCTICGYEIS